MKQSLRLVHPNKSEIEAQTSVQASFEISKTTFISKFEVRGSMIHSNPDFGLESSQWGLWDWDVVELFIQPPGTTNYYEFQVSPLGQFFELEIIKPRKEINRDFKSGSKFKAKIHTPSHWSGTIKVPLSSLPNCSGGENLALRGCAFAILGAPPKRTYWSLFFPKQDVPDFHIPKLFQEFPSD